MDDCMCSTEADDPDPTEAAVRPNAAACERRRGLGKQQRLKPKDICGQSRCTHSKPRCFGIKTKQTRGLRREEVEEDIVEGETDGHKFIRHRNEGKGRIKV